MRTPALHHLTDEVSLNIAPSEELVGIEGQDAKEGLGSGALLAVVLESAPVPEA